MGLKIIQKNLIGQIVGGILAALAVTLASYIWRLPQAQCSAAVLSVYIVSIVFMISSAYVIFRGVVQRDYARYQRLRSVASFLQLLIWGLFFAFPCIYNPFNWAWTKSQISQPKPILGSLGWACVWIGLVAVVGALAWLGIPRSFGQEAKRLNTSGIYGMTRNPQLIGGALLIMGYVLLWPSGYAVGWLVLFAFLAHWMVLTEEEHLHAVHGEAYLAYCKQVPRYLGSL